ncbi:MAG: hypothetical protein ACUZ8O_09760 [Candidatus Anammoxibacter sp.]
MKPIKALMGSIENIPDLRLHILLTGEDNVIVARCLDFSVASHGENEAEALDSLSDSIKDYVEHALKNDALNEIIDPAEDEFWEIHKKLELQDEALRIKESANILRIDNIKEVIYA